MTTQRAHRRWTRLKRIIRGRIEQRRAPTTNDRRHEILGNLVLWTLLLTFGGLLANAIFGGP